MGRAPVGFGRGSEGRSGHRGVGHGGVQATRGATRSAIRPARARDAVAAGEGALWTCSASGVSDTRKSSRTLSRPSLRGMPAGPGLDVLELELDVAAPVAHQRPAARRVPRLPAQTLLLNEDAAEENGRLVVARCLSVRSTSANPRGRGVQHSRFVEATWPPIGPSIPTGSSAKYAGATSAIRSQGSRDWQRSTRKWRPKAIMVDTVSLQLSITKVGSEDPA